MKNLDHIFHPKSIAVVGASNREGSVGYGLFRNLISSFGGKVYPVNPKQDGVQGKKAYSSVREVPGQIDLAVVAVPALVVPEVVQECGQKGVKGCIVVSVGFGEIGEKGKEREKKIKKIIDKFGITLIGPNCLGVIDTANSLNASFSTQMPQKGEIVVLSQSGALGSAVIEWSLEQNIGIRAFVSVGAMLDVNFSDLIQYFKEDSEAGSIVIYMEEVKHGQEFVRTARKFVKQKPIVVLKAGRTEAGKEAAASHTGALSGREEIYEAAFRQAGVLSVKEMSDIFTCLQTLRLGTLPKGPRLAIVTNAGGAGVMAVDAVQSEGAKVATLSEKTIDKLNKKLPPAWSKRNPVDVLGDASPETYGAAIEACIEDKNVDGVLVLFTAQYCSEPEQTAKVVTALSKQHDKPILSSWIGHYGMDKAGRVFSENNVPSYLTPEKAVEGFVRMNIYRENLKLLEGGFERRAIRVNANKKRLKSLIREDKGNILPELRSKQFLREYGIPVVETFFAEGLKEAMEEAGEIGFPVVIKIQSPDIVHKTEVGGVICSLDSRREVGRAFKKMMQDIKQHRPSASIKGVSVQRMVQNIDYELILGSRQDPNFGPIVLFGHGGLGVEIYRDRALGLLPLNRPLARRIMEETRIFGFLKQGYGGRAPADIKLLEDVLLRFSCLVLDFPEIKEIDVNPLAVCDGKPVVLDARVILNSS